MDKCVIVPDSFKGTMSSLLVADIMKKAVLRHWPECRVTAVPVADGGEGTVDCFLAATCGEKVFLKVNGPFMEETECFYGLSGETAVIEMAAAAGLPLVQGRLDPLRTTTFGVGELMADAIGRGCRKIILGLGGSCTNDAGAGMAAALGVKFYDRRGRSLIPVGGTLSEVADIDITESKELLKGIEITAMCDIDNPMYGRNGAAYVFAPQKGADGDEVALLDDGLRAFAKTIKGSIGVHADDIAGAGAAGAMGAGVYALLGGELKPGIDIVLELLRFDDLLNGCDYVFTGEGRIDNQSLSGKVIVGVGRRAKQKNVPVIAVAGAVSPDIKMSRLCGNGITEVYETSKDRQTFRDIQEHCTEDLEAAMERALGELYL